MPVTTCTQISSSKRQSSLEDNGQNWEEVSKIMLIRKGDEEGNGELRVDGGINQINCRVS